MFHKLYVKTNITKLIIFFALLMSIIISKYNLINHDKFFLSFEKNDIHKMIKYDA